MTVFVSLLRAVNLGGPTQVRMTALASLLTKGGLEDVHTLLQSGNVVFSSDEPDSDRLERTLEIQLARGLGLTTDVFVRTRSEWQEILRRNPFPREAETDPAHLVVTCLKRAPTDEQWKALRGAIRGRETVHGSGRQAYIVYPDGIGRSKLTATLIEKQLATRGTSRNWNTVLKLDQLAAL
jgi:uncharacterized protein (DUF1697 family)